MKKIFLIWPLMLLVITACAPSGVVTEVQPTGTEVRATVVRSPTLSRTLTATALPPTATKTLASSPTPIPTEPLACKPVLETEYKPGQSSGKIVLDDHHSYTTEIFDLDSGEMRQLVLDELPPTPTPNEIEIIGFYFESPDFRHIAFDRQISESQDGENTIPISKTDQLVVLDENLMVVSSQDWDPDWGGSGRWVAPDTLLQFLLNANDGNQVAINPMTGSQRILRSPVDLYKYMVPCSLGMYNPPVWGPTLRYGIYAQNSNDDYEPGFPYAEHIMWDNQGKTIVGGINTLNECRPTVWSPNGKAFVVAANQDPDHYDQFELYQLDLSGQESKLTSFSKQYEQTDITRYAWSPEGEKIAFSLNAGPGTFNGEHLTILDIPSGDVTEFCLSSSFMPGVVNTPFYAPIWSPDGNAIVIEILGEGERTTQVVLLDLEPATSSVIAENMAPVGWLKGK